MIQQLQLLTGIILVSIAASMMAGLLCLAINKKTIQTWREFWAHEFIYILNGLSSLAILPFVDFKPENAIIISFGLSFMVAFIKVKNIIKTVESIMFKSKE